MRTLSRKFLFILVSSIIIPIILFALLAPAPTRADVGIQPILPDGSHIQPGAETPIQMVSEKVVFNVRQATEWDAAKAIYNPMAYGLQNPLIPIWQLSVAEVTADFNMANPTKDAVSMTVWFPLASSLESDEWESHPNEIAPRIENFQLSVAGQPLTYTITEMPNPRGADYPLLPWASFPVTFPARQETLIHVSYLIWAQEDISGVGMFLSYIFQTGAGWAGPIGRAELVMNLPYIASSDTIGIMPDGGVINGCQVRWTWENFEPGPQDDFTIWLIRQARWEELETARIRVINWPDGEAYLNLADTYRRLILGKYNILPGFGEIYQPLGVQAAQEAIRLLPNDGRPHYELAIFYLAALPENPTSEDLAPLLEELRGVAKLTPTYEGDIRDWMEFILSNDLWVSLNDNWATETVVAELEQMPTTTPTALSKPAWTPSPTATVQLSPTQGAVQPETTPGIRSDLILLGTAAVIGWIVAGYLFLQRRSGG